MLTLLLRGKAFTINNDADCSSASLIRNHFAAPEAVRGTPLGDYLGRAYPARISFT